jgi:hypothetical protein
MKSVSAIELLLAYVQRELNNSASIVQISVIQKLNQGVNGKTCRISFPDLFLFLFWTNKKENITIIDIESSGFFY